MMNLNYLSCNILLSDIQGFFEFTIKKGKKLTDNATKNYISTVLKIKLHLELSKYIA